MKQYIGDSVYLEVERGMLKLTTDEGLGPTNTIYLEPEVYTSLVRVVDAHLAVDIRGLSPVFVEQDRNTDAQG